VKWLQVTATLYGLECPGIESRWGEIFRTYPDRLRVQPSLLYNGYRVFPGGKVRPGRDADHTPPSSAEVEKEMSYTSTHPMGPPGPVTGFPFSPLLTVTLTVGNTDRQTDRQTRGRAEGRACFLIRSRFFVSLFSAQQPPVGHGLLIH
jgi:hypothetical protein